MQLFHIGKCNKKIFLFFIIIKFRAPELLFAMPEHSTAVDMWAVGCIFAEMICRRELFPGRSVNGQIKIILHSIGTPSNEVNFF